MTAHATTTSPARRKAADIGDDAPHILVVDDDRRIRSLLQRYLQDNGYRVTTAETAAEARKRLKGLAFDLLVLDIMMPGEDGLSLAGDLRTRSDVPILLLTARGESEDRIAGFEAGADDYLAKPFEPRELLLRLDAIIRRARPAAPRTSEVRFGPCRFDLERGELTNNDDIVRLTTAETVLLDLFARNPGTVFSRADLCERTNAGLERSVDVQINRLRRKIEADPRQPVYLQTVRGVGYMLVPD